MSKKRWSSDKEIDPHEKNVKLASLLNGGGAWTAERITKIERFDTERDKGWEATIESNGGSEEN